MKDKKLLWDLIDVMSINFEKKLSETTDKLQKAMKYCEDNNLSANESIDYIYENGWNGSKEELTNIINRVKK